MSRIIGEAQAMHIPFQIRSGKPYPLRAMLAFGVNTRMWPGTDFLEANLRKLDFIVDVELFMTESSKLADVVLPACTSLERRELKIYPEHYVIWTQRAVSPLGESRPDIQIILDLAKMIAPEDLLMQKGYEACIDWMLEPMNLTIEELKRYPAGYTIKEVQTPPFRKYEKQGFATPSGKMEFTSTILRDLGEDPLPRYSISANLIIDLRG